MVFSPKSVELYVPSACFLGCSCIERVELLSYNMLYFIVILHCPRPKFVDT